MPSQFYETASSHPARFLVQLWSQKNLVGVRILDLRPAGETANIYET